MSISRRNFFRGLVGQNEDLQREQQRRIAAVEAHVRTNLLPYDFALTAEQTAEVLASVVARIEISGKDDLFTYERCSLMREVAEERIERWREEYSRAEEVRRQAVGFVSEFLAIEATAEDLQKLRGRFQIPDAVPLEEEIDRQIRIWLSGLSNARLAICEASSLRDLIFSEIRSWC